MGTIHVLCRTSSDRVFDTSIETCKNNLFDIKYNTIIEDENMIFLSMQQRDTSSKFVMD